MAQIRTRSPAGVIASSLARVALVGTGAHLVTYKHWRQWCLGWGSTADELQRRLPGDELLEKADIVSTRSVSIEAPAAAVWPWLVQMGPGRGGAYTYDWIENLFGLGMHSADGILPQYQHLEVGDAYQLGTTGPVMRVALLEPERSLVLHSDDGHWVWLFALTQEGDTTRLISRNRIAAPAKSALGRFLATYVMEPGSLIMERKMLLGIKARAERLASTEQPPRTRSAVAAPQFGSERVT